MINEYPCYMHYSSQSAVLRKLVMLRHTRFRNKILKHLGEEGTVAIVGNASSIAEKGLGEEIDAHVLVVRINRGMDGLQPNSTGTKTNVLATSLIHRDLVTRTTKMIKLFLCGPKTILMSPSSQFIDHHFGFVALGYIFNCYPQEYFQKLVNEIGAKPSTGLMTIEMFTQFIDRDRIYLYGFDFYESPNRQTSKFSSSIHSWDREKLLVQARISSANIN